MSKGFWLGVIGGIFGILGGIMAIGVGGVGAEFGAEGADTLSILGGSAILFSILGIACGVMEGRRKLRAVSMIISGIAVLISISLFGVLTAILFIIGGIVIYRGGGSSEDEGED